MAHNDSHDHKNNDHHSHHHILPTKTALIVGGILLFMTVVTVWVAGVDLGRLNFPVAMLVASFKAFLVGAIFMNLAYDKKENTVIFLTSFLFLAIFISFTASDWFFRGDVYVKAGQTFGTPAKSKFKKPWEPTPELIAHGKELFAQQCVSCHGADGKGDGPAAAALNPHPRNFTADAGWKNGRKPSMVFKTLKEGIPGSGMASFATLPAEDRWALSHFVISLGPKPTPKDTSADFAKIGLDPSKEGGGGSQQEASIPISFAMERVAEPAPQFKKASGTVADGGATGHLYAQQCASCHGEHAEGGVNVKRLGTDGYLTTSSLAGVSSERFNTVVTEGLPGDLMPSNGSLSRAQLSELYQYVKSIAQ